MYYLSHSSILDYCSFVKFDHERLCLFFACDLVFNAVGRRQRRLKLAVAYHALDCP